MHVQRYLCRRVHYGPSGPSVYVDGGDQAGGPDVRGGRGRCNGCATYWGLFKCRSVYVELVHVSLWSQQHWNTYLLHSATSLVLSIKNRLHTTYTHLISDAINICINLGIAVYYSRRLAVWHQSCHGALSLLWDPFYALPTKVSLFCVIDAKVL